MDINRLYFEWLCHFVYDGASPTKYSKLLSALHDISFVAIMPMDENRSADGIELRYRFGYETGVQQPVVAAELDNRQCSMLEMLVALCSRCEESIMANSEYGNRTSQWFWNMIVNLGLGKMTDEHFDINETRAIILRFMNREYGPNGEGGIVRVYNRGDLRKVEIWYQVMWYLTQFEEGL